MTTQNRRLVALTAGPPRSPRTLFSGMGPLIIDGCAKRFGSHGVPRFGLRVCSSRRTAGRFLRSGVNVLTGFQTGKVSISRHWLIVDLMVRDNQKNVTISFFELLVSPDEQRVRQVDWDVRLNNLRDQIGLETIYGTGRTLDGIVHGTESRPCLSLTLDRSLNPRERKRGTGERKMMKSSGDEWDPAEETVAVFFDRNIFGILNTGRGAPTHAAVATWLNFFSPPKVRDSKLRWVAKPIARDDIYKAVLEAKDAQITQSVFTVMPKDLSDQDLGLLGLTRDFFWESPEGLRVTVTLQAGTGAGRRRNSEEIGNRVDEVFNRVELEKARVNAKIDGGKTRVFNLLEEKITHSVEIPASAFASGDQFAQIADGEIRLAYGELKDILLNQIPDFNE